MARIFQTALGQPVVYTASGASPVTITGIFNNEFFAQLEEGSPNISSTAPGVAVRSSDVPNLSTADLFEIDGVTYQVADIQPKDPDMTHIVLHEV